MTAGVSFTIIGLRETRRVVVEPASLVMAGWTGRDIAARDAHIEELKQLGVAPPKQTPTYYEISPARLTTSPSITVIGDNSSGEVEFALIRHRGELLVGVGSDHTDRELEKHDVRYSKQVCEKPIGSKLWPYADIRDHWDRLVLSSWLWEGEGQTLYQQHNLTAMMSADSLMAHRGEDFGEDCVMFGGSFAAIGHIRPSAKFAVELHDPVLNRTISHQYDVTAL